MSFRLPTLTLGRNSNHARRRCRFSLNCGEIPELTSLSLCKLGFNSPDNPRHVLLKPAIQSEKGNEKELLL